LSRDRIIFLFVPPHFEGRYAIVTYRGAGCGGCKRRSMRNVKSISHDGSAGRRRPKSRGPGVAMLTSKGTGGSVASAVEVSHGPERWHSSPPGRARDKPFQPLRAERRTKRRDRGDSTRVLFTFAREAADALSASGVPRALNLRALRMRNTTDAPASLTTGWLAHDPEKCEAVFGSGHAQIKVRVAKSVVIPAKAGIHNHRTS